MRQHRRAAHAHRIGLPKNAILRSGKRRRDVQASPGEPNVLWQYLYVKAAQPFSCRGDCGRTIDPLADDFRDPGIVERTNEIPSCSLVSTRNPSCCPGWRNTSTCPGAGTSGQDARLEDDSRSWPFRRLLPPVTQVARQEPPVATAEKPGPLAWSQRSQDARAESLSHPEKRGFVPLFVMYVLNATRPRMPLRRGEASATVTLVLLWSTSGGRPEVGASSKTF